MVSHKVLVAIILLNVYIGVQSVFYLFGGVLLTVLFAMAFLNGPRLLDWANSPPHLQFNKYVLTGYRPISSVQDCIRSLFYLHNELGNIYTHGEYNTQQVRFLSLNPHQYRRQYGELLGPARLISQEHCCFIKILVSPFDLDQHQSLVVESS